MTGGLISAVCVCKKYIYIFDVFSMLLKFDSPDMAAETWDTKFRINCRGAKEEQTIPDQVKPTFSQEFIF